MSIAFNAEVSSSAHLLRPALLQEVVAQRARLAAIETPVAAMQAEALLVHSAINRALAHGYRCVALLLARLALAGRFCTWQLINKQTTRHAVPG